MTMPRRRTALFFPAWWRRFALALALLGPLPAGAGDLRSLLPSEGGGSVVWSGMLLGGELGFKAGSGQAGDAGLDLVWSGYTGHTDFSRSQRYDLSSESTVFLGAGDPSGGSIALRTTADASGVTAEGEVLLHPGLPDGASIYSLAFSPLGAGNGVMQYAFGGHGTGVAFLALVTDGAKATGSAYGAVADQSGFQFTGIGDLSGSFADFSERKGLTIEANRLMLTFQPDAGADWQFSPRIGLVHHALAWSTSQTYRLDMSEGAYSAYPIPPVSLSHATDGKADYFGLALGIGAERELDENLSLSLEASLGPALYRGRLDAASRAVFGDYGTASFGGTRTTLRGTALVADVGAGLLVRVKPNVGLRVQAGIDAVATLTGDARPAEGRAIVAPKLTIGLDVTF